MRLSSRARVETALQTALGMGAGDPLCLVSERLMDLSTTRRT